MNIGIKYCGGCNPRYNRSKFILELKEKYKDNAVIEPIKENALYDVIIIMNGCSSVCVNEHSIKHKGKILSVASNEDFQMVCDEIDNIVNK